MNVVARILADGGLLAIASLVFGVCSLILGIAQLVWLRRVNLVPAIVGTIAVTFFAGMLGQSLGQYTAFQSLGATSPEDRTVLLAGANKYSLYPVVIALTLCFFSALLGTVAATLRANLKPR